MFRRRTAFRSWIALGCALLAWCAAFLFWWRIGADESGYLAQAQKTQSSSAQAQEATIARLAVQSSGAQIQQVASTVSIGPADFADMVNSVASSSGASLQIGDALPESTSQPSNEPKGSPQLYAYGFSVQLEGSFGEVMRALQLLQTIPAPSTIDEVDLARMPATAGVPASWQMNVQMRLVTTDNVSS